MSSERRRWWLGLGVVVAACLLGYLPALAGKILFFRDLAHWTYPARSFVRESLARGDLPLWNPAHGLGFSVLANPLYGLFYPPNLLYLGGSLLHMVTWVNLLHLLWGAVGVLLLARAFGCRVEAGCVGAVAWGLGGYATSSFSAGVLLPAGSWVPWCALGFVALVGRAPAGWRGMCAGATRAAAPMIMAFLLGEVFVATMAALFGFAVGLVYGRWCRPPAPAGLARPRIFAGAAAACVIAGLCAAVVVVPAAQSAAGTARATPLARELAEQGSFHPLRFVEMVAPGSMGEVFGPYPGATWIGDEAFPREPLFFTAYFGVSVLALVALSFGRGRPLEWALGALTLAALLIALGRHTPVHAVFRTVVRPLAYMRYPEKYLALVWCGSSVLAALGAERVLRGDIAARRLAVLAAVPVLVGIVGWLGFPSGLGPFWVKGATHGVAAAGATLGVLWFCSRRPSVAPQLLVLLVALDLASEAWRVHEFASPAPFAVRPRAADLVAQDGDAGPLRPRLYRADAVGDALSRAIAASSLGAGEIRWVQSLIPNTAATWGLSAVPGYDAAIPSSFARLWESGRSSGRGPDVLRLLAATHALMPSPAVPLDEDRRSGFAALADPFPAGRLYRVRDALPRAFVAEAAGPGSLFDPEVLSGRRIVVETESGASEAPPHERGTCSVQEASNQRLLASCTSAGPGYAVFVEQYDLGWRATVDGAAAPVLRANLVARAVRIPAGTHRVEMVFEAPGLRGGLGGTLLALLLLAACGWLGRQKLSGGPTIDGTPSPSVG